MAELHGSKQLLIDQSVHKARQWVQTLEVHRGFTLKKIHLDKTFFYSIVHCVLCQQKDRKDKFHCLA